MKKILIVLLAVVVVISFGCATKSGEVPTDQSEINEAAAEPIQVALLVGGSVNDGGFFAMAYKGLLRLEEEYDNVEISYTEQIPISDYEDIFRNYASSGFDLVIGHGYECSDAAVAAASEYPETCFLVTNGGFVSDNLISVETADEQVGFIAGALSAMLTETKIIGIVSAVEIPPMVKKMKGFYAGAKYVDQDIEVLSAYTGDFFDNVASREVAIAMIENGADILCGDASLANLGVVEACSDLNKRFIGTNESLQESDPDTVVNSVKVDGGIMFTYIMDEYFAGTLEGKYYSVGVQEGAVLMDEWYEYEDKISDEIKNELQEIIGGIAAGNIDVVTLSDQIE